MSKRPSGLTVPSGDFGAAMVKDLTILAMVAAGALAVAMAVRPVASFDIGYHLAYGEHFLDTGRIVQTNQFIYTRLSPDAAAGAKALGPGCRLDADGSTYHFINANWLSQVVLAGVHRAGRRLGGPQGGMVGLSVFRGALVAAIFAVVIVTLRRHRVAWPWIAPAVVLIALTSYERFDLRPELFGYLVLVGQWALLVSPRTDWRRAAGVIALQVLAVNFHSYFLLGIFLPGAMLVDVLLRWLWRRAVTHEDAAPLAGRLRWLAVTTAGVVLACLCNPWFLRGAAFPIQTLLYLRKHSILGGTPGLDSHPWALIGELPGTLGRTLWSYRASAAYVGVLALAGAGALAAAGRRRWGWLLVIAGMTVISLLTRRNIALGAFFLVPLSLISLTDAPLGGPWRDAWGYLAPKLRLPKRPRLSAIVTAAVALATTGAAAWWTAAVVSNRFDFSERRSWRFGLGASTFMIPLEQAKWINDHDPPGNLWCDFASSSNIMYFTRPHRSVPILTNTWAYPPYVMRQSMEVVAGLRPWEPVAEANDVGTVVLRFTRRVPPLIGRLSLEPNWLPVQLGVRSVVFLRGWGAGAALARRAAIDEDTFDLAAYVDACRRADPVPAAALYDAGRLLFAMEWYAHAIAVWDECLRLQPDCHEAQADRRRARSYGPERLATRGLALADRGTSALRVMTQCLQQDRQAEADAARRAGLADWQEARRLLGNALKIDPDHPRASEALERLRRRMDAFQRGVILLPDRENSRPARDNPGGEK